MTAVRVKRRAIVKPPVASRIASATSAEPATTARRNQGGSVPPPTVGPPSVATRSAGSKAAATFSCGWSFISSSLDVRAVDDQAGDHVHDQGDPKEDEARGDQGVHVEAGGLREIQGDVGRD